MPSRIREVITWWVLVALIAVFAITIVHRLFFFATPPMPEPRLSGLQIPGYVLKAHKVAPPYADEDFAFSSTNRFSATPTAGEIAGFDINIIAVHSRTSDTFDVENITKHKITIKLSDSSGTKRLVDGVKIYTHFVGQHQGSNAVQTCVAVNGIMAVEREDLSQPVHNNRVRDWRQITSQILGTQANLRWECLLVTLSGQGQLLTHQDLERHLREAAQSVANWSADTTQRNGRHSFSEPDRLSRLAQ